MVSVKRQTPKVRQRGKYNLLSTFYSDIIMQNIELQPFYLLI